MKKLSIPNIVFWKYFSLACEINNQQIGEFDSLTFFNFYAKVKV